MLFISRSLALAACCSAVLYAQVPNLSATPVISGCPTTLTVAGAPGEAFFVAFDSGPGPVVVNGLGVVALDLGPNFGFLFENGVLDTAGRFDVQIAIPTFDPATLPSPALYLQALTVGPSGAQLSNGLTVQVLANPGLGFTATPFPLPVEHLLAEGALFSDIDNDGDQDLVIANSSAAQSGLFSGPRIWINEGGLQGGILGNFAEDTATRLPNAISFPTLCVAAGDVDGDGDADLFFGADDQGSNAANRLYINPGGLQAGTPGHFLELAGFPQGGFETQSATFADLDRDGDLDLLCGNGVDFAGAPQRNEIFDNTLMGFVENLSFAAASYNTASESDAVAVADLDQDGFMDLIIGRDDVPSLLYGDGLGGYQETGAALTTASLNTTAALVEDFDGDGRLDVFFANINDPDALFLAGANRSFTPAALPFAPTSFVHMDAKAGDLDNDGDMDIVVTTHAFGGGEQAFVYRNQGGLQNGIEGQFAAELLANSPSEVLSATALADVDGDGDLDIFLGSQGFFGPVAQDSLLLGNVCQ